MVDDYLARFYGSKIHNKGICDQYTRIIEAKDPGEALSQLWKEFEYIIKPMFVKIPKKEN